MAVPYIRIGNTIEYRFQRVAVPWTIESRVGSIMDYEV